MDRSLPVPAPSTILGKTDFATAPRGPQGEQGGRDTLQPKPSNGRAPCAPIRVRTQLGPPDQSGGEDGAGQEVSGELVVACGDASEVLQAAEHPLDPVALPVRRPIVRYERLASGNGRDHRLGPLFRQEAPERVGVIGLVGDQSRNRTGSAQQRGCHGHIMLIARRDQQNARPTGGVGQRVERGRAAAARAPDRLLEGPPFPPAAERCALTCELSIDAVASKPVLPVSALNIASQVPCRLHRLNRL